jgi:predicted transcriptional regulator
MEQHRAKQGRRSIDWLEIKAAYIANGEVTVDQLAKRFEITASTVRKHAADEKWVEARQAVIAKADVLMQEKLVEQRIRNVDDFNLDDLKLSRALRSEIARELSRLKQKGTLDGKKINELAAAHEKAQKVGRLALGLNTNSNELSGKGGEPLNFQPPIINLSFYDDSETATDGSGSGD